MLEWDRCTTNARWKTRWHINIKLIRNSQLTSVSTTTTFCDGSLSYCHWRLLNIHFTPSHSHSTKYHSHTRSSAIAIKYTHLSHQGLTRNLGATNTRHTHTKTHTHKSSHLVNHLLQNRRHFDPDLRRHHTKTSAQCQCLLNLCDSSTHPKSAPCFFGKMSQKLFLNHWLYKFLWVAQKGRFLLY